MIKVYEYYKKEEKTTIPNRAILRPRAVHLDIGNEIRLAVSKKYPNIYLVTRIQQKVIVRLAKFLLLIHNFRLGKHKICPFFIERQSVLSVKSLVGTGHGASKVENLDSNQSMSKKFDISLKNIKRFLTF